MIIGSNEEILDGCLLPVQYNSLVRSTRYEASEAEKSLLRAVLEDAIRTYLSDRNANTRQRRLRFLETKRWFEESADCGTLFAYETLCEALGIEPHLVRERLGLNKHSRRSHGRPAVDIATRRTKRQER